MKIFARVVLEFLTASVMVALVHSTPTLAKELSEFYRGARAMGMGNAFTAISDDADAVFYNPAGIALNRRMEVRLVNPKFDMSTDDIKVAQDISGSASSGLTSDTISKLYGKNLYAGATVYPSIHMPYLTLGYYVGGHFHFVTRNTVLPVIDATYIIDRGVVGGTGFEIPAIFKGHFLRSGVAVKWLTRQGFDLTIPISSLVTINSNYLARFRSAPASGVGANLGLQYDMPIGKYNDFVLGGSWLDVGDTTFGKTLQGNRPPSIRSNLTAGVALIHKLGNPGRTKSNIKLSAEARHLNEKYVDPRLKAHVGVELVMGGLPFGSSLALQAGWNQDSYTAGAKVVLWSIEVSAVTYGIENQSSAFLNIERRYMAQATWKFDLLGEEFPTTKESLRKSRPRSYGY